MNKDTENKDPDFLELKAEVKAGFAAIEQQMKTIFNTLDKLDKTINGNGHEGVVTRVARIEERLNGTWKTLLIIGWLADFLIAAGAIAVALFKH